MRHMMLLGWILFVGCTSIRPLPNNVNAEDNLQTQKISELISKIDDHFDLLHSDFTPAVHQLIKIGIPALEQTLPLILVESETTRLGPVTKLLLQVGVTL